MDLETRIISGSAQGCEKQINKLRQQFNSVQIVGVTNCFEKLTVVLDVYSNKHRTIPVTKGLVNESTKPLSTIDDSVNQEHTALRKDLDSL